MTWVNETGSSNSVFLFRRKTVGTKVHAFLTCLGLNIKYWTSMRWLGLFTNKTFRKHRKLVFPHGDFIIWLHLHRVTGNFSSAFSIRILSSAIFHPHFIIRFFLSAIRHPPSAAIRSALYRDPFQIASRQRATRFNNKVE